MAKAKVNPQKLPDSIGRGFHPTAIQKKTNCEHQKKIAGAGPKNRGIQSWDGADAVIAIVKTRCFHPSIKSQKSRGKSVKVYGRRASPDQNRGTESQVRLL